MAVKEPSGTELQAENEELRRQLEEAQETLQAIRKGAVDALVIDAPHALRIYTLEGAERPYRLFLEHIQQGAVTLDDNGTILYCNHAFADLIGMPHEQLLGTPFQRCLAPADLDLFTALLEKAHGVPAQTELHLQGRNQSSLPVYIAMTSFPALDPPALCVVVTDLRQHKRHEELLAAEALSRSILDQAVDAIIVCDREGVVIRASYAAYELCADSPLLQLFERAFPLVTCSSQVSESPTALQHQVLLSLTPILRGATWNGIEVGLQKDVEVRLEMLLSAGPLRNGQQEIIGCVVTLTDISDRKRAEGRIARLLIEAKEREQALRDKQEQLVQAAKLASLGELATGVAHELNNPLNNIGLFIGNLLDLIEEEAFKPEAFHQGLTQSLKQVHKAAKIISHLRTFGRLSPPERQPVAINDIVTSALSLIEGPLRQSGVEVVLDLSPEELPVMGNAIQLEQVVLNLLANARDAVSETSIKRIAIRTTRRGQWMEVTVKDSGAGIPAEHQSRIFDPFFTTKEVGKGTGLGLSISYGIIKEHGGEILVESDPNEGTTFVVTLPSHLGKKFESLEKTRSPETIN